MRRDFDIFVEPGQRKLVINGVAFRVDRQSGTEGDHALHASSRLKMRREMR